MIAWCAAVAKGRHTITLASIEIASTFFCQPLDRLSRYEYLLWRQARHLVFVLESLRRRKRQPNRSSFPFSFRRRAPSVSSEEHG